MWQVDSLKSLGEEIIIFFPDDINEYKDILKIAEKYISKTIYKTFDKEVIKNNLNIDYSNIQTKDIFIEKNKDNI